jgi:hypothetical protein
MRVLRNNTYIPSPQGLLLDGWLEKWTVLKRTPHPFDKIISKNLAHVLHRLNVSKFLDWLEK